MTLATDLLSRLADQLDNPMRRGGKKADTQLEWCRRLNVQLERKPLDFETRPWLRAIYADHHPHIVLIKGTQVGGSVWAILRCLYLALMIPDWRGTMYLFPTKSDVLDFSTTRVRPLLEENEAFRDFMGSVDNQGVRQLGTSYLYFRGMRSKVSIKSVPADAVIFDELDEATESAKAMAMERLASSPYQYSVELSNPTVPQYGIDLAYSGNPDTFHAGSDQREWFTTCAHCGHRFSMVQEFPADVGAADLRVLRPRGSRDTFDPGSWYRACPKCEGEIDPCAGDWVAQAPGVKSPHGYRLSQLFSAPVDPAAIAREYRITRYVGLFYNLKIGKAYISASDALTAEHVLNWCSETPLFDSSEQPCTMGVDQGNQLHVVISRWSVPGQLRHYVAVYELREWEELDALMSRYRIARCVVDGLPEQRPARAFARRFQGRVFLNFYNAKQKGPPSWNEEALTVLENRTEAIDALRSCFREEANVHVVLPRPFPVVVEFAKHLAALKKKRDQDDEGKVTYTYVRTGPDHFAHAAVYDSLCWHADVAGLASGPGMSFGTVGGPGPSREMPPAVAPGGQPRSQWYSPLMITNPAHPDFGRKR